MFFAFFFFFFGMYTEHFKCHALFTAEKAVMRERHLQLSEDRE